MLGIYVISKCWKIDKESISEQDQVELGEERSKSLRLGSETLAAS